MKREPLLSDEQIVQVGLGVFDRASVKKSRPLQHLYNAKYCGAAQVRDHYEAARAKDAELIQRLVNALEYVASYDNGCPLPTWEKGYDEAWAYANAVRKEADAHGFKPTEQ